MSERAAADEGVMEGSWRAWSVLKAELSGLAKGPSVNGEDSRVTRGVGPASWVWHVGDKTGHTQFSVWASRLAAGPGPLNPCGPLPRHQNVLVKLPSSFHFQACSDGGLTTQPGSRFPCHKRSPS